MKKIMIMLVLLIAAGQGFAGSGVWSGKTEGASNARAAALEFNLQRFGLLARSHQHLDSLQLQESGSAQKSVFLATVYSGLLPGSGEFYSGSYWKAALFFGLEVAGWTTYAIYNHKGNDGDKTMRAFADKNWSEQRYWSKLYYEARQQGNIPNLPAYDDYFQEVDNGYILTNYSPAVVNSLRYLEEALGHTHKLPASRTQQYYEMIYKYLTQFGTGWRDADFFTTYYGNTNLMTPMMFEYRGMRNDMNHFYDIASGSMNAILINHVLSALDAALTARKYNHRGLSLRTRVNNIDYFGEKVQLYGIQLSW